MGLIFLLEHEGGNTDHRKLFTSSCRKVEGGVYEPDIAQSYVAMNSNRRYISPNSLQLLETFQELDWRWGNTEGGLRRIRNIISPPPPPFVFLKILPPKRIHPNIWNVKEKLFPRFPWPKSGFAKCNPSAEHTYKPTDWLSIASNLEFLQLQ
jgi:hypothetical protein